MDAEELMRSPVGQLVPVAGDDFRYGPYACFAFLPMPLSDLGPLGMTTIGAVARASSALARLDQACAQLPSPELLIRPALYREALDTSALEGTLGQLTDVLEADLPGAQFASPETREILGYVNAALWAFESVQSRSISIGLLNDAQAEMFVGSEKPERDVGRVRQHQVWIGPEDTSITTARFVPVPGDDRLKAALEQWEAWVNADSDWPVPLRAAVAHYQFETLHPYGDGNGRIGRLVIVLQLLRAGALTSPALTISPWFYAHRDQYQDELLNVSRTGNWEPWVQFFCRAIEDQCSAVYNGAQSLIQWRTDARDRINKKRWTGVIYKALDGLAQWPLTSVAAVASRCGVTTTAATNIVNHLVEIGVLTELTGRAYGRVFGAITVMDIVNEI